LEFNRSDDTDKAALELIDMSIVNWKLELPASKGSPANKDESFDEMMFQAQMIADLQVVPSSMWLIVYRSIILLHRMHSLLPLQQVEDCKTCVSSGSQSVPDSQAELHTVKTLQAAENVAKLVTMPIDLIRHTHFFTCALALSAATTVSSLVITPSNTKKNLALQYIRLCTGALTSLSQIWPTAETVLGEVRKVARQMTTTRHSSMTQSVASWQ
jgi:hypothetical protein